MKSFELIAPNEDVDIAAIRAGILRAQARFADAQHRPLARGTHSKGVCVRGTFEVFDLDVTIEDPVLRKRLQQGLFTKPGVYDATIRFANAASTFTADYKSDVRAVSFFVTGPDGVRRDFSMNNGTTFPINDVHTFAVLERVLQAGSRWPTFGALLSLSPREWASLIMTIVRGVRAKRNSVRPFQSMRFWSTVPFRHGANEAMKYSVTARPDNPAHTPERGADMLRDELIRHVQMDSQLSEFSFAIQLLEADRMRHRGRQKDPSFWIENASVEWPEVTAPFHEVGRLILDHGAPLSEEDARAFYIDVTEHSTVDSQPLGGINRARAHAEKASREARLSPAGEQPGVDWKALPAPARAPGTWIGRLSVRSIARAMLMVALIVGGLGFAIALGTITYVNAGGGMLPVEVPNSVSFPDNGLGAGVESADRQTFYYTPQGAGLKDVRYSWFVNLELPLSKRRLSDPSVLTRYGFLIDTDTRRNPDRLPVGFTRHFDPMLNETLLDVTCAACHTGQIQVTKVMKYPAAAALVGDRNAVIVGDSLIVRESHALRIDGGQANHAFTDASFGHFLPMLISSMTSTVANPFKFNRFARRVLGDRYPEGRWALHREMRAVIWTFVGIAWNEQTKHLSPTKEGYGRTDALARISNTVFGENLVAKNYAVGDAPVSYPPLWNIWKFDWVQYNVSVSQPMARNIGESMGVGAKYALVNRYGGPLPDSQRFRSSARIADLTTIEHTLRKLQPPAWDSDILGAVDSTKAREGLVLFNQHCVGCHGPHVAPPGIKKRNSPLKSADEPEWLVASLCAADINTDPNTARNFSRARIDITKTGMTAEELRRLARHTQEQWIERQTVYLRDEIGRLGAFPDSVTQLQKELAGLRDAMEQSLSQIDPANLSVGAALSYLGTMIRTKAYADGGYSKAQQDTLDGFGVLDMPQVVFAYKSRPLGGMWATPPFLHNGSVPSIYYLLSPPSSRPKTFRVGSREYDPVKLGLSSDTSLVKGFWLFDTSLNGNHNSGHEFGPGYDNKKHGQQVRPGLIGPLLTEAEKMAILEHLKVRNDDRDGPKTPSPYPTCVGRE